MTRSHIHSSVRDSRKRGCRCQSMIDMGLATASRNTVPWRKIVTTNDGAANLYLKKRFSNISIHLHLLLY